MDCTDGSLHWTGLDCAVACNAAGAAHEVVERVHIVRVCTKSVAARLDDNCRVEIKKVGNVYGSHDQRADTQVNEERVQQEEQKRTTERRIKKQRGER